MDEKKVTEALMLAWLAKRYGTFHGNGARWIYATHVRNAAGFNATRTADAVAVDLWPSKGMQLHGHEVKVSRSDWLRELKEPEKATAVGKFCERWWLVVPDLSIVKAGELPADWGLMLASPAGTVAVKHAPPRSAAQANRSFMVALLRAAVQTERQAERLARLVEVA